MGKEHLLGTHATSEQAEAAKKVASNLQTAMGGRKLGLEVRPRYDLIAVRGRQLSKVIGDFTCGLHTPEKHFTSQQGLAAHRTIVHKKGRARANKKA